MSSADDTLNAYLKERAGLLAVACSVVGNPHVAEDLVQDGWLRWRKHDYPLDSARPILIRIIRNLAIDWLRRQQTERAGVKDMPVFMEYQPDTERVVIGREDLRRVVRALEQMPERSLAAFRMKRIHGRTYKDIAKRLQTSEAGAYRLVADVLLQVMLVMHAD